MQSSNFFTEIRRRRVLPVAGAYIAIAWLVTEIAGYFLEQASAPAWSLRLLAIVFLVGFPVAVVLAWIIQVGLDGKRALDPSRGQHKTVIGAVVLAVVATAGLAWLILPRIEDAPAVPGFDPMPDSIAVLPFLDPDATPREVTIGNTLYTALTEGLDASDVVQVILRLKALPPDMVAYGRSVRVANLLFGQVLRLAGETRVELTLLDVGSGKPRWTRQFDWDPTGIKELGTEISNDVLRSLDLPAISTQRFAGTDSREAYDAFLLGGQHAASFHVAKLLMAMGDYQRAIDLDPDYVLAYVALAETTWYYMSLKGPVEAERESLAESARQALEMAQKLDSGIAAVISALGFISGDRELAIQAYEHALEIDPNHARSYQRLGLMMARNSQLQEAERLVRKALSLDPLNADWHNDLAGILWAQGRDDEALAEVRRSIELEPELVFNHMKLARWVGYDFGRLDEAIIHARKAYSLDSDNGLIAWDIGGWYADLGAKKEAMIWGNRQLELRPGWGWSWLYLGLVHWWFGEDDEALPYIERALELDPGNIYALRAMSIYDIEAGRAEQVLQRWQQAFPVLTSDQPVVVDTNNNYGAYGAMLAAQCLVAVGESVRAQPLLESLHAFISNWENESPYRDSMKLDIEPEIYATLGMKRETLDALRRSIIDGHWHATAMWYDLPVFDFVREEPEFQEVMGYLRAELAAQRARVRQMECNGELAPAPGVELPMVCD